MARIQILEHKWGPRTKILPLFWPWRRLHRLEPRTRSPKTVAKLIQNNAYCFFITIFRLAIPVFFRFTDVTELIQESQYYQERMS